MRLSLTIRRTLAVALLVAVVLGAWRLMVEPLITEYRNQSLSAEQSVALLKGYLRVTAGRDQVEAARLRLRREPSSGGHFLRGDSVDLAAAELQNDVKELITANGGSLKSMTPIPARDRDKERFAKVAIRVIMLGDTTTLQSVLYALESADPYLFVERLDVSARRGRRRREDTPVIVQTQVRFDVHGYLPARTE